MFRVIKLIQLFYMLDALPFTTESWHAPYITYLLLVLAFLKYSYAGMM